MITSLYIDNYRCFSNFEVKFNSFTTFLGPNGSGKSACMQVLINLRDFVTGSIQTKDFLTRQTLTRWDKRLTQTFGLKARIDEHDYDYRLVVVHPEEVPSKPTSKVGYVAEEKLLMDGNTVLEVDLFPGDIHLTKDDGKTTEIYQGDDASSGMARIIEKVDNRNITRFRAHLAKTLVLAPVANRIPAYFKRDVPVTLPRADAWNFSAFIDYLRNSNMIVIRRAEKRLAEGVLGGLVGFQAPEFGEGGLIQCVLESEDGMDLTFRLDELSAGQITAIILHIATAYAESQGGCLILDEPGNFLAVSELQPFLDLWKELALEKGGQVIMATHHPIAIDYLAGTHGLWFDREATGPARNLVKIHLDDDAADSDAYLRVSDLIARGWLSGLGLNSVAG